MYYPPLDEGLYRVWQRMRPGWVRPRAMTAYRSDYRTHAFTTEAGGRSGARVVGTRYGGSGGSRERTRDLSAQHNGGRASRPPLC
jgi:hypothetical protein